MIGIPSREVDMPQGNKAAIRRKEERKAKQLGRVAEKRGATKKQAARLAWSEVGAGFGHLDPSGRPPRNKRRPSAGKMSVQPRNAKPVGRSRNQDQKLSRIPITALTARGKKAVAKSRVRQELYK